MTDNDDDSAHKGETRQQNARLRGKITEVLNNHPELRDVVDEVALRQGAQIQEGMPFLERIQANLQERARTIFERRPDLEHRFDG